uniref:Uncharacterized protein n=1 Tax=Anguilla anguilla TaxID=7936 RepID=A0A0E9VEE2_ANGAN
MESSTASADVKGSTQVGRRGMERRHERTRLTLE